MTLVILHGRPALNTSQPSSSFVPANLNAADWSQLQPLFEKLQQRAINSVEELEAWLLDISAVDEQIDQAHAQRYIDHTCHTDDPAIEKAYMSFVEEVMPHVKPVIFELQKKFVASEFREQLNHARYFVLERSWRTGVLLFRKENVALETQSTKAVTRYNKLCGQMSVTFKDKEYTLQQLARFVEEPDRAVRQQAWELSATRRSQDRDEINTIFQELLDLRQQVAANTGLANYRDYIWQARERFDYTPQMCTDFGDAVAEVCLPLVEELDRQRKAALNLDTLRPWDLSVDVHNRPSLRPFEENQIPAFITKTRQAIERVSPELGAQFGELKQGKHLDLESRKGKKPGGYQCSLEADRQTFIFMNAVGAQRDVETLVHEAGHAFHYLAACDEPLVFLRQAPLEFCEVASMSMELLTMDHLDVFYNEDDAARAKRSLLEGIVRILPWIATIDGFQHWLYTHPGHSLEQRTQAWLKISGRFESSVVDWSGYEELKKSSWQKQGHLFGSPFYYIEYGIAQLGALQLWQAYQRNATTAIASYRRGLALGGRRPLPDLFAGANIKFDFSATILRPLVEAIQKELALLPV